MSRVDFCSMDRRRSGARRRARMAALCALLIAALAAQPCALAAGLPDVGVGAGARPLSDAELGQLRGRFVPSGGQIVYFGLELVSQWQVPGSQMMQAGAEIGINLHNPNAPQVVVEQTWTSIGGAAQGMGPGGTIGGGLGQMGGGVGQLIQVSGNGNKVVNRAFVDVTSSQPDLGAPPSTTNGGCGGDCQATIGNDSLNVSIQVPGAGMVAQMVGAQHVIQSAQLSSSFNQVANTMQMSVQMVPTQAIVNNAALSGLIQSVPSVLR